MNTALAIAIIALLGSITSTIITVFGTARLQSRRAARQVLQTYQEPLLVACYELQARLHNILKVQFVEKYITDDKAGKRTAAIDSTLYVFAQYFGWREIIRQEITYLHFSNDSQTQKTNRLLGDITKAFLSEEYGAQFMVWRVEQRGLGERMIASADGKKSCLGYASFLEHRESMREWLGPMENDLESLGKEGRDRLRTLQHLLLDFIREIDAAGTLYPSDVDRFTLEMA
jgi:hypothetical protein